MQGKIKPVTHCMVMAGTIRMPKVIVICEEHPSVVLVKLFKYQSGKALVVLALAQFLGLLQELNKQVLAVKLLNLREELLVAAYAEVEGHRLGLFGDGH